MKTDDMADAMVKAVGIYVEKALKARDEFWKERLDALEVRMNKADQRSSSLSKRVGSLEAKGL